MKRITHFKQAIIIPGLIITLHCPKKIIEYNIE